MERNGQLLCFALSYTQPDSDEVVTAYEMDIEEPRICNWGDMHWKEAFAFDDVETLIASFAGHLRRYFTGFEAPLTEEQLNYSVEIEVNKIRSVIAIITNR
jgi:hypothetical protein